MECQWSSNISIIRKELLQTCHVTDSNSVSVQHVTKQFIDTLGEQEVSA